MSELNKQTMIDSFRNISFYGEKRGEQDFLYYSELLKDDLKNLEVTSSQGNYREKFIDKIMAFYHSQSNCASAFIVGPARFDNRRHEKLWKWRDNKLDLFNHWRDKYFRAVNRVRTLTPEQEIDVAIERLEFLETEKAKANGECSVYNVTTKIRETKKKVLVMKSRIEAKKNQKDVFFKGGKIFIKNDRVIIAHDEKPERDIIQAIKKNGFRWSPKMGNWCRKHTANARYDASFLLKNVFGGEVLA